MSKRELIKDIESSRWYTLYGNNIKLNNYSVQGLEETLKRVKQYDKYFVDKSKLCRKCGNIIIDNDRQEYCKACYESWAKEKKSKRKIRNSKNLKISLSKAEADKKPTIFDKWVKKQKLKIDDSRDVRYNNWIKYFQEDFPDYRRYMGFLRANKLDGIDIVGVKNIINDYDEIIKRYEKQAIK
jgi:hypothetical protein